MKIQLKETIEAGYEYVDLGVVDNRGRKIGLALSRSVQTFVPADESATSGYWCVVEPGTYSCVNAQVTRNGNRYGAGQPTMRFEWVEKREEWIAKKIEACRKANLKKFASFNMYRAAL